MILSKTEANVFFYIFPQVADIGGRPDSVFNNDHSHSFYIEHTALRSNAVVKYHRYLYWKDLQENAKKGPNYQK